MAFEKTHLINLKTADGKTLLIPQIPLRTVINDGYKLDADGSTLVVTSNLESLKAAIDAQIDGKVAVVDGELTNVSSALDSKITAVDDKVTALDTKVTNDYATKLFVGEQIAAIDHLKRAIVTELPTGEAIDLNTIYMVKMGDQSENVYREYMYLEGKWEIVGDSNIDFSNYYTKGEVDTTFGSYYTKGEIDTTISGYYTKGEIDAELADYVTTEAFSGSIANYALKTELQGTSSTLNASIAAVDSKLADYALTTYVDAQDGSTLTSANTYADAAVSTASSALNASIAAVDGKFANYYDKDGIAGLGYATVTQVNTASSAAVTEATGYTDQQLANYLDSTAASQAFILRDEIAQPYSHIVYTSQFGSDTFDLHHGSSDKVTVYTTAGADAKFAPLDGAELTNVVSITGDKAHIAVSKVTATELQLVNEVQLAGIILGKDGEGAPVTHITETMANFQNVDVASNLTVRQSLVVEGMLNIDTEGDQVDIGVDQASTGTITIGAGNAILIENQAGFVDFGDSIAHIDLNTSKVQVYDEWTDGQTTSTGLADVATEHDIADAVAGANEYTDAASSNIMSTINALPGIGDGAILYDVIEEQI